MLISIFQYYAFGKNEDFKFQHLEVKDGLSQGWVRCIYQDKFGFLWFGTGDGLNRFDGYEFKIYKNKLGDPHSLLNNNIKKIYEDLKGNLWIGTQGGLSLYNREDDDMIPVPSTFQHSVEDISEDKNGNLFLAGAEGINYLNTRTFALKRLVNSIYVNAILKDNGNNFWLGTYSGLYFFNSENNSIKEISIDAYIPKGIGNNNIRSIYKDTYGRIWLGTNNSGLLYIEFNNKDYKNPKIVNFIHNNGNKNSISKGAILALIDDHNGNLWIGIENGGLDILDLNNLKTNEVAFNHFTNSSTDNSSISSNSIHSIFKDNQNTVWVGAYGGALNYYNKLLQKFKTVSQIPNNINSLGNNHINVLYNEKDYLWIGTEGGLDVLNKKDNTYRHFVHVNDNLKSLSSNAVWAIFRDSRKNMWIGTWAGGLNLMDEKSNSFIHFQDQLNFENSIGVDNINQVIEDKQNNLWMASMIGGLKEYNYQTGTFKRFLNDYKKNSISNNWACDVMAVGDNEIWIATSISVDLYNKETGKFISFQHDSANRKSLSYYGAIGFYIDSKNHIWVATGGGLNLFHRADSTFTCYREEDGLPNNTINAICEDKHGNLWLSTNKGISEFINGINVPVKPKFKNFDVSDGLQGNEFIQLSNCKDENGNIYFGGTNGYNVFNPDSLKENTILPTIVFTDFLLNNKPVIIGDNNSPLKKNINLASKIILNHKYSVFTIEFAALSFISPEKNQYAFMMEGFEKDWNYVGFQRSATYTNLDPGKYIFKVKASNNDGLWNNKYSSIEIDILPPWWLTWWAKTLYAIMALIALYLLRKYTLISINMKNQLMLDHIEKEKSEQLYQLKNQFYTNMSHELRTPLTLIIGPLKQLISNGTLSAQVETIYRNANRLKTLVDQILDFSKVENNMMKIKLSEYDVVGYIKNIVENFNDYAKQKNISLLLTSNASFCKALIDEDKIEKIVTNIISNAIKNTPEQGKVTILMNLYPENSKLKIEITDTGFGISPEEIDHIFDRFYTPTNVLLARQGTGIGLNLTLKLIKLLNGSLEVSSKPDEGSTFAIDLPVKISDINFQEIELHQSNHIMSINQTQKLFIDAKSFQHEYTILIIDDNVDICVYIESILNKEYNVIWENNSTEALNHINKYLPDLIISDVMMPELDGFELCRQVKCDLRFSHIPLILLTAKVGIENQVTGYDKGADDYILKPFEGEILKARIKNLIRQIEKLRQHFIGRDGIINHKVQANALDISFMEEILSTIKEKYVEPEFNVNQIIEKMGMSRSVFYKKFKALSVESINDLVKNFRLHKAAELLTNGNLTISQVANECGFSDPAYFSKVFKEYYKVSPKDYCLNDKR